MRLGISGDIGSFSEAAARLYAAKDASIEYTFHYLIDMEGVLSALSAGIIEIGIFPFVNYNSGIVWPAFAAMGKYQFVAIDDIKLNVEQCLLALPGMKLENIHELYSYTPAFEQCVRFIKQHAYKTIDWGDTAKAARDLAFGVLPANSGVVAGAQAAKSYGLSILKQGIQDIEPNITRFIVIKGMKR